MSKFKIGDNFVVNTKKYKIEEIARGIFLSDKTIDIIVNSKSIKVIKIESMYEIGFDYKIEYTTKENNDYQCYFLEKYMIPMPKKSKIVKR